MAYLVIPSVSMKRIALFYRHAEDMRKEGELEEGKSNIYCIPQILLFHKLRNIEGKGCNDLMNNNLSFGRF